LYGLKLYFSIMRFYELFAVGLQDEIEKEEVDDHWRFVVVVLLFCGLDSGQASVLHIGIANSHFKQNFIIVSIYTLGFGNIRIFSFSREHFAYRRLAPKIYFIVEKKKLHNGKS